MKSNYTYYIKNNITFIIDLGGQFTSVTNNAEQILTDINQIIDIKNNKIIYRDTNFIWDEIIPIWDNNTCTNVSFNILNLTDLEINKLY